MTHAKRRPAAPTALTAFALGLVLTACLPEATTAEPALRELAPAGGGAGGKGDGAFDALGCDLVALYEEYTTFVDAPASQDRAFSPSDPDLLVSDGRVAVDATASGDPALLERALIALGLIRASRFGPVVSGYLPIDSLPEAAVLTTLRRMTAARASLR